MRPPETEFERGARQFALLIMRTVFFLVLFVLLAGALLHHPFLESLLFAVALAVGLTPEFLPMISAVTLSRGAAHMARRKVVVKHLEAIENFGSMDILCSDKTGTLTSGDMVLDRYLDPLGRISERPLALAYINSSHQREGCAGREPRAGGDVVGRVRAPLRSAVHRRPATNRSRIISRRERSRPRCGDGLIAVGSLRAGD
jgi:magnesium-transporting ATPase (P-type)